MEGGDENIHVFVEEEVFYYNDEKSRKHIWGYFLLLLIGVRYLLLTVHNELLKICLMFLWRKEYAIAWSILLLRLITGALPVLYKNYLS